MPSQKNSAPKWAMRFILAGVMGWIGYHSILQSAALVLPSSQIEKAYQLAPNNGRLAGQLSQSLYNPEADKAEQRLAVAIAHDAISKEPTAVEAIATLAADALINGDRTAGERWLAYSHQLSRRELRTQLMAIELAVARDNIAQALHHYDIALRTKNSAPALLFPVLTAALPDENIRIQLIKILAAQPDWGRSFIDEAARKADDPRIAGSFFQQLQKTGVPISEAANQTIMHRLLATKYYDEAWVYYSILRPGSDRRHSRDPNFQIVLDRPNSFDWVASNRLGISTVILADPENGLFDFSVSMGHGGRLLQQLQMLPAGDYILEGRSSGIEQPARSRPYWLLQCQDGGEIARVEIGNSSEENGRFQAYLHVPTNCPVQMLVLVARSSDAIGGVSGQIYRASIRPR